jgi:polysaccharide export outer membrane protein
MRPSAGHVGRCSLLLAVAFALGCPSVDYDYTKEPDPRTQGYVIGPTDLLKIDVWKNNDLSVRVRVRPDGSITMPLIGEVRASGLKPAQLRDVINRRLATYIRDESAVVTVTVVEVSSYKINVAGKVERPGIYSPRDFVTVLDALALAGGPTRFADSNGIIVIRRDTDGHQRKIPFVYSKVTKGERLDMNITLVGGDTVVVP